MSYFRNQKVFKTIFSYTSLDFIFFLKLTNKFSFNKQSKAFNLNYYSNEDSR